MNKARKIFLFATALLFSATVAGVIAMTEMERQARRALPAAEQIAAVIESVYDGAVCLSCDITRMAILIVGSIGTGVVIVSWFIYETVAAGRKELANRRLD